MSRIAFSTVACPEWPLDRVFSNAEVWRCDGVELRTDGYGAARFACDPCLTDNAKIRRLATDAGVQIASVATGLRFDEPIRPPVIGRVISDTERAVREARRALDLAAALQCPMVRVFGFEAALGEARHRAVRRIVERLELVMSRARNLGVRVVIENGGSFPTATDLAELMDLLDHPLLGASYSMATAYTAGESPDQGANVLADRLWLARIKDCTAQRRPCPPGKGVLPVARFVEAASRANPDAWLVVEWDRAWIDGLAPADEVLPEAFHRVAGWADGRPGEVRSPSAEHQPA